MVVNLGSKSAWLGSVARAAQSSPIQLFRRSCRIHKMGKKQRSVATLSSGGSPKKQRGIAIPRKNATENAVHEHADGTRKEKKERILAQAEANAWSGAATSERSTKN